VATAALRRVLEPRELVAQVLDGFDRNDLLTFACAIAFKLLYALIPLALFALGLLGGTGLQGTWTSSLAPQLRRVASPDAFRLVDDTVRQVLAHKQVFWSTAGGLFATWQMSGAVRGTMDVLDRVYSTHSERSFWRRMAVSIGLGAALIVLLLAAAAAMELAPRLVHGPAVAIARWPVTIALLWGAVTLVMRLAPAQDRPAGRVTLGATLVILAWLGTSAVFAWYLTAIADYGSVFGALATVVVILTYLYLSTAALLTGVQVDALIQAAARR
jgi:membrane protein